MVSTRREIHGFCDIAGKYVVAVNPAVPERSLATSRC